jgi:hypothetical protein
VAATGGAAGKKPAAPQRVLPEPSVARFEILLEEVERMVKENTSVFAQAAQDYREEHRAVTSRALTPLEAAQIASGVLDDRTPEDRTAAFQAHEGLRAYDEPQPQEVLLAAGVATAPAFLRVALRVTALVELDDTRFEEAMENGTLDGALDEGIAGLRKLSLQEARERAGAALEHFSRAAGADPKASWSLIGRSVWQALQQALSQAMPDPSGSSSLIASQPSTDGADEPSSTEPATAMPVA